MRKYLLILLSLAFIIPSFDTYALSNDITFSIDAAKSYYVLDDKTPPFGANDRFYDLSESVYGQTLTTRATIPTFEYNGYDISLTDLTSQDTYDLSSCGDNGCNASFSIRMGFTFGCDSNFCNYQSADIPINDNSYDMIPNIDFANYVINNLELVYRDLNGRVHTTPLSITDSHELYWSITQYNFGLWFDETPYSYPVFGGTISTRDFAEFVAIRVNYDMTIIDWVSDTVAVNTLQVSFYNNLALTYTDQDIGVVPPMPTPNETPDIGNLMSDDSIDNSKANRTLNGIGESIATNNVISNLLLLPITLYQRIINVASSNTCQRYYLGNLYGTDLYLPCIDIDDIVGSTIWGSIDLFVTGYFIISIRKRFVDIFNNMTSLKDRGNEIE